MLRGTLRRTDWGDLVLIASRRRPPQPGALRQVQVVGAGGAPSVVTVVATGIDEGSDVVVGLLVRYQAGPGVIVRANRALARAVHDAIAAEARPLVATDDDAHAYARLVGAYVGRVVATAVACGVAPASAVAAVGPLLSAYTAALTHSGITLVDQTGESVAALVNVAVGALSVAAHAAAP